MFKSSWRIFIFVSTIFLAEGWVYATPVIAPGTPVFDITAATHMVDLIKNSAEQLRYHKQMIDLIGKGEFTPSSLNYLGKIYTSCIGKRFILPEFLPKLNVNICSAGSEYEVGSYYTDNVLANKFDNEKVRLLKYNQLTNTRQQLRKKLLSASTIQLLYHSEKDPDVIAKLYNDLKASTTQIAIEKVQAQIQLKILEELQEVKSNQALIMQSIGLTN